MFSKVISRVGRQQLTSFTSRAFRASAVANNKNMKPSIGDAVTILQSKVSGINQVVSVADEFGACALQSQPSWTAPSTLKTWSRAAPFAK